MELGDISETCFMLLQQTSVSSSCFTMSTLKEDESGGGHIHRVMNALKRELFYIFPYRSLIKHSYTILTNQLNQWVGHIIWNSILLNSRCLLQKYKFSYTKQCTCHFHQNNSLSCSCSGVRETSSAAHWSDENFKSVQYKWL